MDDQIIYLILGWMLFRQSKFPEFDFFFYHSVHENEKSAKSMR